MTREEYFNHPSLNQSRLKKLQISELEFMCDDGTESTSQRLGTLAHQMVLEPHKPVIVYEYTRRGKDWEAFQLEHADKLICIQSEHDKAIGIVESLKKCKFLTDVMTGNVEIEKMHLWNENGIDAKAMLDIVNHDRKVIVDFKTTKDIILEKFQSQSFTYGYHIQDDWYRRPYQYEYDMYFVVVQSKAPYDFGVFKIDDELRDYSKTEVNELLARVPEVLAKNPAEITGMYPNNGEPMLLTFPKWKAFELFNEDENEDLELNWT